MLNKNSVELITYFMKNKCLYEGDTFTKKTYDICIYFLQQLIKADKIVRKMRSHFHPIVSKIRHLKDIPKSTIFVNGTTPPEIEKYIHTHSVYSIKYHFSVFQRKIQIYFIVTTDDQIDKYNEYAERILIWLHILQQLQVYKLFCIIKYICIFYSF